MSEKKGLLSRVAARVRAMLPQHWQGKAGKRYRETTEALSEYSKKNIRIQERLKEAPDVIANSLKVKSSETLLNVAEEENKHIATELARQTFNDKVRQEKATADRMEIEARTAKVKELQERIALVEKLRAVNCVPVWDKDGNMLVLNAPANYNWAGATRAILQPGDLALLDSGAETTTKPAPVTITLPPSIPSEEAFGTGGLILGGSTRAPGIDGVPEVLPEPLPKKE